MLSKAFNDDPTWLVIQPLPVPREELIFSVCEQIARHTAKRGMNYLLVKDKNIYGASAGLLASPAGYKKGHWGSNWEFVKAFVKGSISPLEIGVSSVLSSIHTENCGDLGNHVYVGWISCSVGSRSGGLGGAIFKIVNNVADQCKAYVYLENSKKSNLGFYGKQGLQVQ